MYDLSGTPALPDVAPEKPVVDGYRGQSSWTYRGGRV